MAVTKRTPTKWTHALVEKLFSDKGLTLLDFSHKWSVRTPISFKCRCGEECKITIEILRTQRDSCRKCSLEKRKKKLHQYFIERTEKRRERRRKREEEEAKETTDEGQRPTKKLCLGSRWPDPKPSRSDFPDIEPKEWSKIWRRWHFSTPEWREKCKTYRKRSRSRALEKYGPERERAYFRKYSKTPKAQAKSKSYKLEVREACKKLLERVSVEGHCVYQNPLTGEFSCKVRARDCDIDHIDPNTVLGDGQRRKQWHFANIHSLPCFEKELQRNTGVDGKILLQALCPHHHALKTFSQNTYTGEARTRWKAVSQIKLNIGRCQYEACLCPELLCLTEVDATGFHFDHLFTAGEQNCPDALVKVTEVATMVKRVHSFSLEDIMSEITKCRLVHALCHRRITAQQRLDGRIRGRATFEEQQNATFAPNVSVIDGSNQELVQLNTQ
jgi:hypothetical protein